MGWWSDEMVEHWFLCRPTLPLVGRMFSPLMKSLRGDHCPNQYTW